MSLHPGKALKEKTERESSIDRMKQKEPVQIFIVCIVPTASLVPIRVD